MLIGLPHDIAPAYGDSNRDRAAHHPPYQRRHGNRSACRDCDKFSLSLDR